MREPHHVVHIELLHDGRAILVHSLDAEAEDVGHLLRAVALGDQLQDVALTLTETRGRWERTALEKQVVQRRIEIGAPGSDEKGRASERIQRVAARNAAC